MRVMILGAGGAVGAAVTRYAIKSGCSTDAVLRAPAARLAQSAGAKLHICDVREASALQRLVERQAPDLIVNAAFPSGQPTGDAAREQLFSGMAACVFGVIRALRDARFTGRLALLGSAMSYGDGDEPRRPTDRLAPQSFRGAAKASESILMAQLAGEFDLHFTELRIFTGYGPFEQRERLVSQLVRAGLTKSRVRLTEKPFERDWVHYDDIARACLSLLENDRPERVINVCSGELTSTHAVAGMMEQIVGRTLIDPTPYEHDDRYGAVRPGVLPSASDGFNWRPELSLQQGLEETWAWAGSRAGSAYVLEESPR